MAIRLLITRGFGNGTFNGTIATAVLRGYISAVPTAIVINANRLAKVVKTYKAIVIGTVVSLPDFTALNETIPHADEDSNEQQRILIENLILIKALLNDALERIDALENP